MATPVLKNPAPSGDQFQIADNPIPTLQDAAQLSAFTSLTVATTPTLTTQFTVNDDGVYTAWAMQIDWIQDEHTIQMPVASSGVINASFAQVATSTTKKIIRWTAEKYVTWPSMPHWLSSDANLILLSKVITGDNILKGADGLTDIYTVSGVYTYGLINPEKVIYGVGLPPYLNVQFNTTLIDTTKFIHGLADAVGSSQNPEQNPIVTY